MGYTDDNPAGILLPHLAVLKGCVKTLQLRSSAELQAGQTERALEDIKLMLRLTEAIRNEPIMISHLVRVSMLEIELQTVWEGLAGHNWNDSQLAALDVEFSKLDFFADYDFSMRGERAMSIGVIDYMKRTRDFNMLGFAEDTELWESGKVLPAILFRLSPSGWFEQNKISISQMNSEHLLPIVDAKKHLISLSTLSNAKSALAKIPTTPFTWFDRLFLPALGNTSVKYAHAQCSTDMARIAIALERYRLVHEEFPENLDAILPQFLKEVPHDIVNGKPLNYHLTTMDNLYYIPLDGTERTTVGRLSWEQGKLRAWTQSKAIGFGNTQRNNSQLKLRSAKNFEPLRRRRGLIERWSSPTTAPNNQRNRTFFRARAKEMLLRFAV